MLLLPSSGARHLRSRHNQGLPRSVSGAAHASELFRARRTPYTRSWNGQLGKLDFVAGCTSVVEQGVYPHLSHLWSTKHINVCTLLLS